MAVQAKIILTQAPGGSRPAGNDVEDGVVGNLVGVTNQNNTGVQSWIVELISVPTGPEADYTSGLAVGTLAAAATGTPSASFTPNSYGAVGIKLTVKGSDPSDVAVDYATFACPDEQGNYRPAFRQDVESSKFGGQLFGWKPSQDRIAAAARRALLMEKNIRRMHAIVAGIQSTTSGTFVPIGWRRFEPSNFPNGVGGITTTFRWYAVLYTSGPGVQAQVQLYNVTSAAVVPTTTLQCAAGIVASNAQEIQATLTIPANLDASPCLYRAELRVSAGAGTAFCGYAGLDATPNF